MGEGCPRARDGSSWGPSVAAEQHPPWMTNLVSIPRVVFRAGSPPCVLLRMLSLCSWCAHRSIWRRRTLHFVLEQHPSLSEPLSPGTRHKPNLVTETESVQQLLGVLRFGFAVKFSSTLLNGSNAGHQYCEWIGYTYSFIPGT